MLEGIVEDIETKGWTIRPNFLLSTQLKEINLLFDNADFKAAMVGKNIQRQRNELIRGDFTSWLDPGNCPTSLELVKDFLMQLQKELNRKLFLGLKEFEFHLAKYPKDALYVKHSDRFEKDSSRSFTFIFYLNQEWNPEDGGELVLYDKEGKMIETILPSPGTFVGFLSEDFPHEVKKSKRERRSLTGWMHTRIVY